MTSVSNTHNLLFPAEMGSNRSSEFEVTDTAVAIRAFNLRGDQLIRVEHSAHYGCDSVVWGPLSLCCPVVLSVRLTQVVIAVSGTYRVYIDDPEELGIDDIVATQHAVQLARPDLTITCCQRE